MTPIPSLSTLESSDDDFLTTELRLVRLREQVAVVRTIADQVDHFAKPGNADGFSEQVLEEMARLGCRLLEAAAAMTRSLRPERSGSSLADFNLSAWRADVT